MSVHTFNTVSASETIIKAIRFTNECSWSASVTPPTRVRTSSPSGSRTRDSSAGGGRSNKVRQRLQPLASVARAPLFEVRGVRFTHSPYCYSLHNLGMGRQQNRHAAKVIRHMIAYMLFHLQHAGTSDSGGRI